MVKKVANTKKREPFVLPYMTAKEFEQLLEMKWACSTARMWAQGKTLKKVWKTCNNNDWLYWLISNMAYGHPQQRKEWGGKSRLDRAYSAMFSTKALGGKDKIDVMSYDQLQKARADVFRSFYTVADKPARKK